VPASPEDLIFSCLIEFWEISQKLEGGVMDLESVQHWRVKTIVANLLVDLCLSLEMPNVDPPGRLEV